MLKKTYAKLAQNVQTGYADRAVPQREFPKGHPTRELRDHLHSLGYPVRKVTAAMTPSQAVVVDCMLNAQKTWPDQIECLPAIGVAESGLPRTGIRVVFRWEKTLRVVSFTVGLRGGWVYRKAAADHR